MSSEPAQVQHADLPAAQAGAPLDDVMMAMDVVDTLRHREEFVSRELDEIGREAALMARLRSIYAGQGIQVSDEVLRQGIKALNEDRFVYTPPPPGLATTLARLWAERGRYGKRIAAVLLALVVLGGLYYETSVRPLRQARAELSETHEAAVAQATSDAGRQRADRLLAEGTAAIEAGDTGAAEAALNDLGQLQAELDSEYTLRIVETAFKVPPTALHERIYYLIVEAVAPDGGILPRPVQPEGTTEPQMLNRWGIEVSRDVFAPIDRDFRDDGRIADAELGVKRRGEPDVQFLKPVLGGVIAEW
jgi:hypothetical protein